MERSNPWNSGSSPSAQTKTGDTSRQFDTPDFSPPPPDDLPPEPDEPSEAFVPYSCPCCMAELNVAGIAPLTTIACPSCRQGFRVLETLAGYTLSQAVGNGPAGSVFVAAIASSEEPVALKIFWPGLAESPEYAGRVHNAAAALAGFHHPNIVRNFSAGVENGLLHVASEFVGNGLTLAETMAKRGRLPEVETLTLAQQLVLALQASSNHGVLHGDLKPSNILFTAQGVLKLTDFGHGLLPGEAPLAPADTAQMPYYALPEKLSRSAEDRRSDIYSLGTILFHALAGRPPFPGNNVELVVQKHLEHRAPTVQAFTPDISAGTASVVARMLEKSPARRHQNYEELLEHLRFARSELGGGRPIESPHPPSTKRGGQPVRSKLWLPLAAGVPALLILGLGGWIIFSRTNDAPARHEPALAQAPAVIAPLEPAPVAANTTPAAPEAQEPPPPARDPAEDEKILDDLIARGKRVRAMTEAYFIQRDLAAYPGPLAEKAHAARATYLTARSEAQKDLAGISTIDAYRLVNRANGLCLTAAGEDESDPTTKALPVLLKPAVAGDLGQCWRIQRFAYGESAALCARNGASLTVEAESDHASKLHLGNFIEGNHFQGFKLKKIDGRYFTFASEATGKLLGIDPAAPHSYTLIANEDRHAPDQQWEFQPVPDAPKWAAQTDRIEIEWLSVIAKSEEEYRAIESADLSAKFATVLDAYGPGAFVTLRIPQVAAGVYEVRVGVRASDVRGKFQVAFGPANGPLVNIGAEQDPYRSGQAPAEYDLGPWKNPITQDLAIRFTITGKNPKSKTHMISLDYLQLVPTK